MHFSVSHKATWAFSLVQLEIIYLCSYPWIKPTAINKWKLKKKTISHLVEQKMFKKNFDHFRLSLALLDTGEIMIGMGITRHSYLELTKTRPCLKHVFIC